MSARTTDPLGRATSMLGGSFTAEPHPCTHGTPVTAKPWVGAPGTVGTIAVIGSGKIGLPLALQFASHGWRVHAVDINQALVDIINSGVAPWGGEPKLPELLAEHVGSGRLRATIDGPADVRDADVALVVVPVLVRDDGSIADKALVGATETLIAGAHDDLLVILETTVPIGTTRELVAKVAKESGAKVFGCFSPERVLTGQTFRNLAAYPKLVGGTDAASLARATAFYESVLDAPIAQMQTLEAAEMAKLAGATPVILETTDQTEFKVTPAQLRAAITSKTRLFILNSPSNPTGSVYTPDEIKALGDICVEKGVLIMSDEIYEHLTYDGAQVKSVASFSKAHYDHTIIVHGFAKAWSMTGWRLLELSSMYSAPRRSVIMKSTCMVPTCQPRPMESRMWYSIFGP